MSLPLDAIPSPHTPPHSTECNAPDLTLTLALLSSREANGVQEEGWRLSLFPTTFPSPLCMAVFPLLCSHSCPLCFWPDRAQDAAIVDHYWGRHRRSWLRIGHRSCCFSPSWTRPPSCTLPPLIYRQRAPLRIWCAARKMKPGRPSIPLRLSPRGQAARSRPAQHWSAQICCPAQWTFFSRLYFTVLEIPC
jgi:hypothetical protein